MTTDNTREDFKVWYENEKMDWSDDRDEVFKLAPDGTFYHDIVETYYEGYQSATAQSQARIAELMLEIKKLKTPKWFATDDEFIAESIEDLAYQMTDCYSKNTEIEVSLLQDLGSEIYIVGEDESGQTTLTLKD